MGARVTLQIARNGSIPPLSRTIARHSPVHFRTWPGAPRQTIRAASTHLRTAQDLPQELSMRSFWTLWPLAEKHRHNILPAFETMGCRDQNERQQPIATTSCQLSGLRGAGIKMKDSSR